MLQAQRLDRVTGTLADDVELALERVGDGDARAAPDEDLPDHRLQLLCRLGEVGVVHRHVAPTEQHLPFVLDRAFNFVLAGETACRIARQEHHADAILPRRRKADAALGHLLAQEPGRHLDQQAGAVRELRVPADRAAVVEVFQDREALLDDRMRFLTFDVRNETNPAAVMLIGWVVQALGAGRIRGLRT